MAEGGRTNEAHGMEEQVDIRRAGMDPERVARVVERFRHQQSVGVFPGGQLVVRRRGVLVVDEAVGIARGFRDTEGEPKTEFTPTLRSCVFSAGKPLVGISAAVLEDAGAIELERPVAFYWPEFAQAQKSDITILDVLLHRSGLYLRDIERDWRSFGDWDLVMSRIANTEPSFPRGTLAYQPMGFGWIIGEVVRLITGKPIERFLQDDVLAPAGLADLRLGVPASEVPSLARSYWVDDKPPKLAGEVLVGFEETQNSVEMLTAVLPGAGTRSSSENEYSPSISPPRRAASIGRFGSEWGVVFPWRRSTRSMHAHLFSSSLPCARAVGGTAVGNAPGSCRTRRAAPGTRVADGGLTHRATPLGPASHFVRERRW